MLIKNERDCRREQRVMRLKGEMSFYRLAILSTYSTKMAFKENNLWGLVKWIVGGMAIWQKGK
jgi:hypothetical protein